MFRVLIFDLDDTLYDEFQFVKGGFKAVASSLEEQFGWPQSSLYSEMIQLLTTMGRGRIFNQLLESRGVFSKQLSSKCVQVYRRHQPVIHMFPEARSLLRRLAHRSLYIVTDGNKDVQAAKIEALHCMPTIKKAYITHRYGVRHAKPSTHCFDLIRRREACSWSDMVYVGDNPAKDFVNLNPLGVTTIRVLTGAYRDARAKRGYDALFTINSLRDIGTVKGILE